MKKIILTMSLIAVLIPAIACDFSAPAPTADESLVATSVAKTITASQPEEQPIETTDQPVEEPTPTLEPTAEPTTDPNNLYAPNPLGPGYTGFIFYYNACFDLDSFQPVDVSNPECDFQMDQYGTLMPLNGALINGANVSFNPPSKGECMTSDLKPDLLAPQTDLYLCFLTTQGSYGFFVGRDLQFTQERLIFDAYIFP